MLGFDFVTVIDKMALLSFDEWVFILLVVDEWGLLMVDEWGFKRLKLACIRI